MANITTLLKAEIARVARKEVRSEIESLKKAVAHQRGTIATLRRELAEVQKDLKATRQKETAESRVTAAVSSDKARRFSPTRLAAHRAKLGLSAADYGKLVGMSGATIYLWEQGKARPSPEMIQRLAAARTFTRSTVKAELAA